MQIQYNGYGNNGGCDAVLKKSGLDKSGSASPQLDDDTGTLDKKERTIICLFCANIITLPEYIIEVDGSHYHTFKNPGGVIYEIGCFSSAKGCVCVSDPVMEHTWFPGYGWSIAVCSNCMIHMGWQYVSDSGSFYGLILTNLTENIS